MKVHFAEEVEVNGHTQVSLKIYYAALPTLNPLAASVVYHGVSETAYVIVDRCCHI